MMMNIVKLSEQTPFVDLKNLNSIPIDKVNWEQFPYKPQVALRIGWNNQGFFLSYQVIENHIKSTVNALQARVSQDSCVEFFVSLDDKQSYYNFEFNCTGSVYVKKRQKNGEGKSGFSDQKVSEIIVKTSLQKHTIIDIRLEKLWELAIFIPFSFLDLESIPEMIWANFYKCGDDLESKHYLSAFEIESEKPNFHLPDFFQELKLVTKK